MADPTNPGTPPDSTGGVEPEQLPAEARPAWVSAQKVVETHRRLAAFLRHGMTVAHIDAFIARTLDEISCRSCFLGYRVGRLPPFPSHACLSVNDCVVHGTAGTLARPLAAGDVLKVDIGVTHNGWIGDAAWTYSFGEPSTLVRRLMDCGKESLRRGVAALGPGRLYLEWARAVQACAEREQGFHLIRGLGGHGYGRKLHAPPFIANTVPSHPGEWPDALKPAKPGTFIAVEPMIAVGTGETRSGKGWPVFVADGSLSVHYEHDVYISADRAIVLTTGLERVPDVIDR